MRARRILILTFSIVFLLILVSCGQDNKTDDYTGAFYNLSLLDGKGFNVTLLIEESKSIRNGLTITGIGFIEGYNYMQSFTLDVERPEGNTIVCENEYSSTLTIAFQPDHTLNVLQETTDPDVLTIYTGTYVDSETWDSMSEEVHAAQQAAQEAREPDRWIDEYFGSYMLYSFAEGIEDAPSFCFTLSEYDSISFQIENYVNIGNHWYYPEQDFLIYRIPYPRQDCSTPGHIAYETDDGLIAFDILTNAENGAYRIYLKDFPNSDQTGIYISGLENIDPLFSMGGKRLTWDGIYTCQDDGDDGTKTISVTQIDDTTIAVDMIHTYADGRVDSSYVIAEIGTNDSGPYSASYVQEKTLFFSLKEDPNTNAKIIVIIQLGIIPSQDMEYDGTYIRQ